MIIRKIELENFRQFYGVQSIDFGKNAENKNVTVIIGGNGSGKTTINQAFIFCLFGPNEINLPDFNNRNHDNLNEILKLCNNNKLKEKENFQMGVKLEFEHNNRVYNIHRFYRFIWRHNNSKFEFRDINQFNGQVIELNGHAGTQEFHQYDVSKIMPKSLHNLFFFDGERMNQLAKNEASSVISNHVIDILGLRVFRKTLRILKRNDHAANEINTTETVEFMLRKELKTPNKDTQELVENISSLEEEIEELKQKKNSLIECINELEHESKLKLDLIKTHSADKSKQERRESLIEANRGLDAQKQRKRQDIINLFSKKFVNVFCLEHSELIKNTIAHSITEDRDIIGINSSAIDSLLEKRKCLCGEPLEKGSEKYEIVSEWKKYLPPQDLSNLLFTLRTDMNDAVNEAEEFLNQFHVFMGDLVDLQDKISKNERELNDIKQDNLMVEKLKKLEHEYENIKNEQVKQKINLSQTEDKIENLNSDLKKLKLELEDLTQGIKENEIVYKKMSLLENVIKLLKT